MKRLLRLPAICTALALVFPAAGCKKSSSPGTDLCGNAALDADETCDDGNVDNGDGCDEACQVETGWLCQGEPSVCVPACGDGLMIEAEECDDANRVSGDGCDDICRIEDGWYCNGVPSNCQTQCGDSLVAGQELCDSTNLAGETCQTLGLVSGALACDQNCLFDVSLCTGTADCGNGVYEYPEECDGSDLHGQTCVTLGFAGGFLLCTDQCAFNTSNCISGSVCGNGAAEQGEDCDGLDLDGESCQSLGWDQGALACNLDCTFNVSDCSGSGPVCGNNQAEFGEECDGNDLDGETCVSQGFASGQLACDNNCDFDTSNCVSPVCGNGTAETGEECDSADLNNQTCLTLNHDGGTLACDNNCNFDESGCTDCGNDVAEAGEACDGTDLNNQSCLTLNHDGGTLACDNNCNFDEGGCTDCGDDVAEGTEQCDGTDFNNQTCETLSHDGGSLACDNNCVFDESGCIDCAPGLELCGGTCVDTLSDQDYCGDCTTQCPANSVCVGGVCRGINAPWNLLGGGSVAQATAHDLATQGTYPTVAYITGTQPNNQVVVSRFVGNPAQWEILTPSPSQNATDLSETVALTYDATTPHVLFSNWGGAGSYVHVMQRQGNGWVEVGAPGFTSMCMMHFHIDFALDGTTPHITTFGAGGCGTGVDYAWWDGSAWQIRSSNPMFGQITDSGAGIPAIIYTDRPWVGVAENDFNGRTTHTVRYWSTGDWQNLVGPLDQNIGNGWEEHMSLAADLDGNIYAAWSEDATAPISYIYVQMYSTATQNWTLLGTGEVSSAAGIASFPSVTVIGTTPYVTYLERPNAGVDLVYVKRFDDVNNLWFQVGSTLNENAAWNAYMPIIVGIGGVPYVAFREGPGPGNLALHVKRFSN